MTPHRSQPLTKGVFEIIISYIIYLFAQKFTRNSKCRHAVAELDGQGSKGALTVAYKIKMEYNMNK